MPSLSALYRSRIAALATIAVTAWWWAATATPASRTVSGPWAYGFPGQNQSYAATLLLLDYSHGFRRRALPGAVLRWFLPADEVTLAHGWWFWLGCYVTAAIAIAVLVYATFPRNPRAAWALVACAASPFGFGLLAAESHTAACTVALLALVAVSGTSSSAKVVWCAALATPVFALVHEQVLVFALPLLWCVTRGLPWTHRIARLIPATLAGLALFWCASTTNTVSLLARATFPIESSVAMFDNYATFTATLTANREWFHAVGFLAPVAGVLLAAWFAVVLALCIPLPAPHRRAVGFLAANLVATAVLAVDWPRFAALGLVTWCAIATLAPSPSAPSALRRRAAWILAATLAGVCIVAARYVDPAMGPFPLAWWLDAAPRFASS